MGRRGPPPEPTALKLLKGNPGHRPLSTSEPMPAKAKKGSRRVPSTLPPAGKTLWKNLVPELERLNLLTKIDDATLHGACLNYARALQAGALVKKQGLTIVTDKGFIIQHPAVSIERNSWQAWLRFATQFGLTPSARSSLHIKPVDDKPDAAADFLFGGAAKHG
jgi:P27 family predicted phage terminase small subunit